VVKGGRYSDEVLAEILATFREYLGPDLEIEVEFVDSVEMVRTGKRLASVSRLNVDFQASAPRRVSTAN
jgi:phenylacetate-CoA ligase